MSVTAAVTLTESGSAADPLAELDRVDVERGRAHRGEVARRGAVEGERPLELAPCDELELGRELLVEALPLALADGEQAERLRQLGAGGRARP